LRAGISTTAGGSSTSTTGSGTSGGSALSGGSSPSTLLGSGTAFGASLDLANGGGFSQALSQQDNRFGKLGIVRVFYQGLPASWASHPELATRPSIISFKMQPSAVLNGAYDSQLTAWFAAAPRTTDVFWSYWHEPENDHQLNLADYRAAWQHISALSRRASNPHLHATLILMGYTTHAGSGRDWHDYYSGSASIDVMGWDAYNTGSKNGKYTDPATLFDPVAAVSREAGKPWGIAETASRLVSTDGGTTGRADWLRAMSNYMASHNALFVAYWDVNASGGSFKLTDQPSINAWRAAVADSA